MNISALKTAVQTGVSVGKAFMSTHRPEILLGTSIATTLGAVVAAARGGYKSGQEVLRAEYTDLDLVSSDGKAKTLSTKEKAELTWMNYLPSAGLTAGALGSTTALHFVHVKEKKALATAALSAVEEMKKGIIKVTDEETAQMLEGRADEEGIAKVQHSDGVIEELYLVRDDKTGRDIWSNTIRIDEAVNSVNKWIAKNGDCELNTFYSAAGFEQTPDGDDWGWSGDFVELSWDLVLKDDGRPVRRFKFRTPPKEGVVTSTM